MTTLLGTASFMDRAALRAPPREVASCGDRRSREVLCGFTSVTSTDGNLNRAVGTWRGESRVAKQFRGCSQRRAVLLAEMVTSKQPTDRENPGHHRCRRRRLLSGGVATTVRRSLTLRQPVSFRSPVLGQIETGWA